MASPEAIAPDIRVVYYGRRAPGQGAWGKPNMLRVDLIPSLLAFAAPGQAPRRE